MSIQIPRGTQDIFLVKWKMAVYRRASARNLPCVINYKEIRTPIFEHTELFLRGVGDTTDIVQKEMYTFKDRGDRSLTYVQKEQQQLFVLMLKKKCMVMPTQPTKLLLYWPDVPL